MKKSRCGASRGITGLAAGALLCVLLLGPGIGAATPTGQTAIHHCVGPTGTPVFTDQPCSSLSARADTPSPPTARRCASTLVQLKRRIIHAFADQDGNALAGLMLWHGTPANVATRRITHLAHWVQVPLLGMEITPATGPEASRTLRMDLAGAPRKRHSYTLQRRDGCLWLQPQASE